MTKDEIIAMARQSGFDTYKNETAGVEGYDCTEELERFAALVAAKEREACAQVCEGFKQGNSATYIDDDWADMCAAAIRG